MEDTNGGSDRLLSTGIVFTRKAVEKALPCGIGVGIGASALTMFVGHQLECWFEIDRATSDSKENSSSSKC